MTGRHRIENVPESVAFTVDYESERTFGLGCLWSLAAAGIAALIGLFLGTIASCDPGPSNTQPAQPVQVEDTRSSQESSRGVCRPSDRYYQCGRELSSSDERS